MISATVSETPVKFRKSRSVSLSGHIRNSSDYMFVSTRKKCIVQCGQVLLRESWINAKTVLVRAVGIEPTLLYLPICHQRARSSAKALPTRSKIGNRTFLGNCFASARARSRDRTNLCRRSPKLGNIAADTQSLWADLSGYRTVRERGECQRKFGMPRNGGVFAELAWLKAE